MANNTVLIVDDEIKKINRRHRRLSFKFKRRHKFFSNKYDVDDKLRKNNPDIYYLATKPEGTFHKGEKEKSLPGRKIRKDLEKASDKRGSTERVLKENLKVLIWLKGFAVISFFGIIYLLS